MPLRRKHVVLLWVLGKFAHLVLGLHESHLRHPLHHRHLALHVQAVQVRLLHHALLLLIRSECILWRFGFRLLMSVTLLCALSSSTLVHILLGRRQTGDCLLA